MHKNQNETPHYVKTPGNKKRKKHSARASELFIRFAKLCHRQLISVDELGKI